MIEREEQTDRYPLRVSKMQQQEGLRLDPPRIPKGIRIVPPEIAKRRAEKFLRDLR